MDVVGGEAAAAVVGLDPVQGQGEHLTLANRADVLAGGVLSDDFGLAGFTGRDFGDQVAKKGHLLVADHAVLHQLVNDVADGALFPHIAVALSDLPSLRQVVLSQNLLGAQLATGGFQTGGNALLEGPEGNIAAHVHLGRAILTGHDVLVGVLVPEHAQRMSVSAADVASAAVIVAGVEAAGLLAMGFDGNAVITEAGQVRADVAEADQHIVFGLDLRRAMDVGAGHVNLLSGGRDWPMTPVYTNWWAVQGGKCKNPRNLSITGRGLWGY